MQSIEEAIYRVHTEATDSRGLKVFLCRNPLDTESVRQDLSKIADVFVKPEQVQWFDNDNNQAEIAALSNLILVAELLRAHLRKDLMQ